MKNSSLFTRIIATSLCAVLLVGTLLMGMVGGFNYDLGNDFDVTPITPGCEKNLDILMLFSVV